MPRGTSALRPARPTQAAGALPTLPSPALITEGSSSQPSPAGRGHKAGQAQASQLLPARLRVPAQLQPSPLTGKSPRPAQARGGTCNITELNGRCKYRIFLLHGSKQGDCANICRQTENLSLFPQLFRKSLSICCVIVAPQASLSLSRIGAGGSGAAQGWVSDAQKPTKRKCIGTCTETAATQQEQGAQLRRALLLQPTNPSTICQGLNLHSND